MEFWGVEVKPNETLKCEPGDDKYLHLSQVSLGESKKDKGTDNITVYVKFNDQKLVLGTLSLEKFPQISYDLVFEKEFELSHSSKNTSLYFCGYKTATMDEHSDLSGSEYESDEEPLPLLSANGNSKKDELGKPSTAKVATAKAATSAAKPKAKTEEPNKADKLKATALVDEDDFDDEDDDDEDVDEDDSDDEDMLDMAGDSDDEDDEDNSDEEDEDTPKKVESGKKRQPESASKTPVPVKKAKLVSPAGGQKTGGDGKKGGHTATPHPAKQVGKTPASGDKSKQQTPKSAGSVTCKSCSKTFNSENAMQAHTKAKHSAAAAK